MPIVDPSIGVTIIDLLISSSKNEGSHQASRKLEEEA
jgi:hypothetical protein